MVVFDFLWECLTSKLFLYPTKSQGHYFEEAMSGAPKNQAWKGISRMSVPLSPRPLKCLYLEPLVMFECEAMRVFSSISKPFDNFLRHTTFALKGVC